MREPKQFKVGAPGKGNFCNPDCQPFDLVSHTSHVNSAINIIEAGEIRPSLVFDESKLNKERILVGWLSPNHWTNGFRYGNVRFEFQFSNIIKNKKFYWVEAIAYKPSACRILITDIDRDSQLTPYDPKSKSGPWWFDEANGEHYYNGTYCLEFMIEAPISLSHLKTLNFVKHHKDMCSIHRNNPQKCPEIGFDDSKGGAAFLTRAVVAGIDLSQMNSHFVEEISGDKNPSTDLQYIYNEFAFMLTRKVDFSGTLTEESGESFAVMRAIMSAYTFGAKDDAKLLCAMFENDTSFANVAAKILAKVVGLKEWRKLVSS